jgi:hypothetical protein
MNIFVLDQDVRKCAEYHNDKHVVKMILETAQLLSSAFYFTNQEEIPPYKLTHKNHPCSAWVRESLSNWLWTRDLGLALYEEYKYRYNKVHKSGEVIQNLPTPNLNDYGITKRPQAMPMEYQEIDPVMAYRNYYRKEKSSLLKYTKRSLPAWV